MVAAEAVEKTPSSEEDMVEPVAPSRVLCRSLKACSRNATPSLRVASDPLRLAFSSAVQVMSEGAEMMYPPIVAALGLEGNDWRILISKNN